MKSPIRIISLLALPIAFCAAAGLFLTLTRLDYIPGDATVLSQKFLDLVVAGDLETAYSFTDERTLVGATFPAFKAKVHREWIRHGGSQTCIAKFKNAFPRQSYGNLVRHFVLRRPLTVPYLTMDYNACGQPFSVSLTFSSEHGWQVSNFQTHAE